MTIDEVVKIVNASQPKPLTSLQEWLLRQAWEGKTYSSMAIEANYVEEYLRKVASGLWVLLSDFWGEPINKNNFRSTLEPQPLTLAQQQLIEDISRPSTSTLIEFPSGPLPIDSVFYIPRPPIEELAYEEIAKPGSVIRITAPRQMGKSSLLLRISAHATVLKYRTASIDFQQADKVVFTSLNRFLRWFSANVSRELQIESKLDDYWDEDIGSKVSCTLYFQTYLLEQISSPIVLTLNEVNRIFEYPEIAQDFLPLLRYWHEQAKKAEIWQKLRLVVAYSTEIFIPLKLTQFSFDIGLPLKLPPFTVEQVQALAHRYNLDWTWTDGFRGKRLAAMVGGHPYLVQLAFYHLSRQEVTPKQLLQLATAVSEIYHHHLQQILTALQAEPELKAAFQQVVSSASPVKLDPVLTYQLNSMGLVTIEGDRATPSCELYRGYFSEQLLEEDRSSFSDDAIADEATPEQLARENQLLQQLLNRDELTQLGNQRCLKTYLQSQWQQSVRDRTPLSLILCEIDFFKAYNDIYGRQVGDRCLQKVALAIRNCVKQPAALVARCQGAKFAVILSQTDAFNAAKIAETIRKKVKALAIVTNNCHLNIDGFPDNVITVSIGVVSTIADPNSNATTLVNAAEKALYASKRQARDRVTVASLANE